MLGKNLTNQTFGYLTPLYIDPNKNSKHRYWVCRCICGKERSLQTYQLTSGKVTSCGCMNRRKKTSSETQCYKRLYNLYCAMIARCHNPKSISFKSYGQKGIYVCDEWRNNFIAFKNWSLKNGYNDTLSIDRIDNSKGYNPSNCRWVSKSDQQQNRSNNIWIEHDGIRHIMAEWCKILNFPFYLAKSRVRELKLKNKPISFDYIFSPKKR